MNKLLLVLLAFLAIFTVIRAFEQVETSAMLAAETTGETPIEIVR